MSNETRHAGAATPESQQPTRPAGAPQAYSQFMPGYAPQGVPMMYIPPPGFGYGRGQGPQRGQRARGGPGGGARGARGGRGRGRGGQSQQASTQQIRNVANQAAGLADSAAMSASVDAALDLQAAAAASIMADRSERLAESLAAAGIQDMEEGEELLEASENVEMLGDILESVGTEAIESGLKLARIGGELAALHGAINALNAPFLKPFLLSRSRILIKMASDQIASSSTHRALAGAARDTAERIGDLGEIEIMEGQEELEASGEVGGEADELRDEARELATSAAVNAAVADAMDEASARLDSARSVEDVREAVRDAGDRVGAIATAAEEIVAAEDTE